MLGKAAANALATIYGKKGSRTGFLYVKGPEILNQYVGQTEQTIRDMFEDARRHKEENGYPAIIFLDEADAILAARGTRNVGIGNTIVPMFLSEMDGLEESGAIVIIATNRPDVLDPAIVRDGRIDRKVTVTRPCVKSAEDIFRLNLNRVPVNEESAKVDIAKSVAALIYSDDCLVKTGLYLRDIVNGAMLANCINIAVSFAIQRDLGAGKVKKGSGICMDDITTAVDRILRQSRTVIHDLGA
jgi:proteasome-associated ATPase